MKGVSSNAKQDALSALLGPDAPNLFADTISRLANTWVDELQAWEQRDLSARQYVYLWADGIYFQARTEPDNLCMLVIIGATPEGKKELIGFTDGYRESTQSWRELLLDLKARGKRNACPCGHGQLRHIRETINLTSFHERGLIVHWRHLWQQAMAECKRCSDHTFQFVGIAGRVALFRDRPSTTPKQAFIGWPTNACLDSFVFAEFFRKTGRATFANSA